MNVMNNIKSNSIPLAKFLAMCELGTRVSVKTPNGKVFIAKLTNSSAILDLIMNVKEYTEKTPHVYHVEMGNGKNACLKVTVI